MWSLKTCIDLNHLVLLRHVLHLAKERVRGITMSLCVCVYFVVFFILTKSVLCCSQALSSASANDTIPSIPVKPLSSC